MAPKNIKTRLAKLGWLSKGGASRRSLPAAVRKFQKWTGLKVDGIAGPITIRHLMAPRICGTPDAMSDRICKWPMNGVTWAIADSLPGVSDAAYKAAATWATRQWNQSCGIALKYTVNSRTANILMRVANLGGPGDTLADSQLPCGANSSSQMQQRYDATEPWYAGAGQPPNGKISLRAVCVHELGHAIGISHLQPSGPRAMMQPYYRPDLQKLLGPDIEQGRLRYGEPEAAPPTTASKYAVTFVTTEKPTVVKLGETGIFQG